MGRKSEGFKLRKFSWSPFWYITYSADGRSQRHSTNKESREEAERYRAQFILALGERQREEGKFTVSDCLEDYMNEHAIHTASAATAGYLRRPLEAYFGSMLVEQITPNIIKAYTQEKRTAKVKDGTIRRHLTILSAAFNHARKEGRINAAPYVPMPSQAPAKERWLTHLEALALIDKAVPHIKLFIRLALATGQRKGAILDLRWEQVDLKHKVIDFNPPGRARTKKKRAVVAINNELLKYLLEAKKERNVNVISFNGSRVLDIKKGFAAACKAAKLKGVTPHTLRHTAGTWMAQDGISMWQISGILGHSNSRTTELYLKHSPDYQRDAVEALTIKRKIVRK